MAQCLILTWNVLSGLSINEWYIVLDLGRDVTSVAWDRVFKVSFKHIYFILLLT